MAYVLAASALSKLVLAHDTASAHPEDLLEPFDGRSEEHIPIGLRWFYCAGLSVALMNMAAISLTHTYKSIPGTRARKEYRLAYRLLIAIIILLLPLAGERLNSLELVALTTCLVVSILLGELVGSACTTHAFWGFGGEKRKCTYSARCHVSKKELESKVKSGEVLNVAEVAARDKSGDQAKHGYSI
jgi:hypothetical protein